MAGLAGNPYPELINISIIFYSILSYLFFPLMKRLDFQWSSLPYYIYCYGVIISSPNGKQVFQSRPASSYTPCPIICELTPLNLSRKQKLYIIYTTYI